LTSKVHALIDHLLRPVQMVLTPGQAGDNPQLIGLIDSYRAELRARGDTGVRLHLLADKAYTHPSTRRALRARRISHTIPERDDQISRRAAKGRRGGRPPTFSASRYKQRNTVERGFNRLKQWRGIATRYDKYAITFLGGVTLAAILTYRR
jgi:transposase